MKTYDIYAFFTIRIPNFSSTLSNFDFLRDNTNKIGVYKLFQDSGQKHEELTFVTLKVTKVTKKK